MDLFSDNLKIDDLSLAIKLFKESREGFLQLFNNSPVCMSMTTTTLGKRIYRKVNKKFLEKFEFTEEEIIGRSSVEIGILDEEESVRVGTLLQEKGRLQNDYVKCRTKSGGIVHTISSIEFMEMNEEAFLVSFFVDITKIIDQQAIIEHHVQELEAMNKELEAFSYSVSHDLRAPLRAINGYTQVLEQDFYDQLDEDGKKMLLAVQRNAKKMDTLIEDLLAFAKSGKQEIRKRDIDLRALVEEVLADVKKIAAYPSEVKIGALHPIKGDYALLKQVLVNLLSNALKYSSKKEHPVVEIFSEMDKDFLYFTVKDNGEGFDMQFADKLFHVFQRLHSNEDFEGTGIGLAIVQRILAKHGGTITAHGEPGKGATFRFSLPR